MRIALAENVTGRMLVNAPLAAFIAKETQAT